MSSGDTNWPDPNPSTTDFYTGSRADLIDNLEIRIENAKARTAILERHYRNLTETHRLYRKEKHKLKRYGATVQSLERARLNWREARNQLTMLEAALRMGC